MLKGFKKLNKSQDDWVTTDAAALADAAALSTLTEYAICTGQKGLKKALIWHLVKSKGFQLFLDFTRCKKKPHKHEVFTFMHIEEFQFTSQIWSL